MLILLIGVGCVLVLIGTAVLFNPDIIFRFFQRNAELPIIHFLAAALRIILGALLIIYAEESKYPLALQLLGWLSIVTAVVLAAIGRDKFIRLLHWLFSFIGPLGRLAGVFVIAFGCFLIYAFW